MRPIKIIAALFITLAIAFTLSAMPTRLVVRVRANDAKFVGSAVGGLKVSVKDALTGKLLAVGRIEGGTGNTAILMKKPITRGTILSKGGAAKAEFTFDISEPVKLEIEVVGPLGAGNNIHREVKTTWLIPGRDIVGDGIIFTFYGLIVHPYSPKPHEFYIVGDKVTIGAHVTPMCGCPVRPGFLWDANKFNVKAFVYYKGKKVAELPMKWAGRISHFETTFVPKNKGGYKVIIVASDGSRNEGVGVTGFVAVPAKVYHKILGR